MDHRQSKGIPENICFCFIDYAKAFDSVDCNKLSKMLKEVGIAENLICLLQNLYAGQEATLRIRHGTMDWFQIRKGVNQNCILLLGLFNLYAEYIMQNVRLNDSQAGIKISRRNINNLRYESRLPGEILAASDMQTMPL